MDNFLKLVIKNNLAPPFQQSTLAKTKTMSIYQDFSIRETQTNKLLTAFAVRNSFKKIRRLKS
jgi:hypothetical protein